MTHTRTTHTRIAILRGLASAMALTLFGSGLSARAAMLESPNSQPTGDFGHAVSRLADLNGDGHDEFVVGAPDEDNGPDAQRAGNAYVYDSQTLNPLFTLRSVNETNWGFFGVAVAGVPDVTGDGKADILVGADSEDGPSYPLGAGRAYVFSGADGAPVATLESPAASDHGYFGHAVAGLGDLNGDGRSELIVGASSEGSGAAYLINGMDFSILAILHSTHPVAQSSFGWAVSGVPDTNSDGIPDILVTAPGETDTFNNTRSGRLYLYSGADASLLFEVSPGSGEGRCLGFSAVGIPDVNEDGRGDIIVGAPTGTGAAYILSGANGTIIRTLGSPTEAVNGNFGYSIAELSLSGPAGQPTIGVGAPGEWNADASVVETGRIHVLNAKSGELIQTILNPFFYDAMGHFGLAVAGVRHTAENGFTHLVEGNYHFPPYGFPRTAGGSPGRVFTFELPLEVDVYPPTPSPTPTITPTPVPFYGPECVPDQLIGTVANPATPSTQGGFPMAFAGTNLVIGVPQDDSDGVDAGKAYLIDVTTGATTLVLHDPAPRTYGGFGSSVAIDGARVAVAAAGDPPTSIDYSDKVYIFDTDVGTSLTLVNPVAEFPFDLFGLSVAISGDVVAVGGYRNYDQSRNVFSGLIHVFNATTGALLHTLLPDEYEENGWHSEFGTRIAISGDLLIAGSRSFYPSRALVFSVSTGLAVSRPGFSANMYDSSFGDAVAISGNLAAVTSPRYGNPGAGSVLVFDATTGDLVSEIHDPFLYQNAGFGYQNPGLITGFGSIAIDGDRVLIGAGARGYPLGPQIGEAYVYRARTGELLQTILNPDPSKNDFYGSRVALSGNMALLSSARTDAEGNAGATGYDIYSCTPLVPTGRAAGDFDSSGCTNIADFLTIIDNWGQPLGGEEVGITDFLALLDNWQQGPGCL